MGRLQDLFALLWADYSAINTQVTPIHDVLERRGETLINDHVAFRTFAYPGLDIASMAAPFVALGYKVAGKYDFPEKKLDAAHFEHPEDGWPKVFISQLRLRELSLGAQSILQGLINQIPSGFTARWDWCAGGRPWVPDFASYEALERESDYAAWMAAFGFRANHFTVLVNALKTFPDLQSLNLFLKAEGFPLNAAGGEIKGSPDIFLEQSSTLAGEADVAFRDGMHRIPGCYYEFARRFPMPDGKVFQGFNSKSADKIFESTHRRSG